MGQQPTNCNNDVAVRLRIRTDQVRILRIAPRFQYHTRFSCVNFGRTLRLWTSVGCPLPSMWKWEKVRRFNFSENVYFL